MKYSTISIHQKFMIGHKGKSVCSQIEFVVRFQYHFPRNNNAKANIKQTRIDDYVYLQTSSYPYKLHRRQEIMRERQTLFKFKTQKLFNNINPICKQNVVPPVHKYLLRCGKTDSRRVKCVFT